MTTHDAERVERDRPEAIAWARAQANLIDADRSLSSALRCLEATRLRMAEATAAEREAWRKLEGARGVALANGGES